MVQCRSGFGTLKDINVVDNSITISLLPWKADAIYDPRSSARMVRYEPNLLEWERGMRKDTVPQQWIDTIESFLLKHNHPSPNAKDQLCKRHPDYPRQKIYAPVIYRYETWDQLWSDFKIKHPAIAAHIQNPNQPNECPSRLLRFHAPWNMMKGTDSSCLRINCEGTNAVKYGAKAAMAIIKPMTAGNDGTTPADERAIAKLLKIYKILEMPSKYAMCVECLPCLISGKLEDAMFKCVDGTCERCGFDKLWKHGVCKRIFRHEYVEAKHEWIDVLDQSSVLATDAWLEIIEWRDYEYKTKPTLASHAQDLACHAAASRAPEPGDLDYEPTENTSARNLTLETKRGTVVDYLSHGEEDGNAHGSSQPRFI